jgi:flagellar hook-associated protein 3 FlgL
MMHLNTINTQRQKYYDQMANGKRIQKPSDDPAGTAKVIKLNKLLAQNEIYQQNIEDAKSFLTSTEASLNAVNESIQEAITIALKGATDTTGEEARSILADEVDYIIDRVLAEANREYDSKYIYGGTAVDQAPFTREEDGTIVMTNESAIDGEHLREIAKDDQVKINFSGKEVFMGENGVFDSLTELRDALQANDGEAVQAAYDNLKDVATKVTRFTTVSGLRYEHIANIELTLSTFNLEMESLRSSIQDADFAEATIKYEEMNTLYQANLQFSSSILQMSLMDYLA